MPIPPPSRPLPVQPCRILLMHFGQMGDAVLALPAARALRAAYPAATLAVLAGASGAQIFRLAGFAPVWAVHRAAWRRSPPRAAVELPLLIARLRRFRFELCVDLHSYKETNLLAWAAGVPARVAMLRATRSWPGFITHPPPPDQPSAHLLDRYCRVLEPLGISVADRQPRLAPSAAERAWAQAALPPDADYLGVCPGAGHATRRWPAVNFAAAARAWAQDVQPPPRLVVFAGPEETEAQLAPLRALPQSQIYAGLTVPELAAALARCRAVLANASGPSHIAAAVGAAVVTIGEIPMFDPPGRVIPVRAARLVAEVPVASVVQALAHGWRLGAPAGRA